MWVLRGAGVIIGVWAIFKLAKIGIGWCKVGLEHISQKHYRDREDY